MESTPLWKPLPRGEMLSVRKPLSQWKTVSPQVSLSGITVSVEAAALWDCSHVPVGRAGGTVGWQSKKSER